MGQTVAVTQTPQMLGRLDGTTNFATAQLPVANTITINVGDFVYFASGNITNATVSGARLIGMAMQTVTGNSTNTNTCLVCVDPLMRYLLQGNTVFSATSVGQYFDVSGTTGAQVITTSSASTTVGPFLCIAENTNVGIAGTQSTSYGTFVLVASALTPYVAG